jgi:capsular polysaccharide biosynthesis protein
MSVSAGEHDLIGKLIGIIRERRIPFAIAKRWRRAPHRSALWRIAKHLYARPSDVFKHFGLFPLPVRSVSYERFRFSQFEMVRPFPVSEVPKSIHRPDDWIGWTSELPQHLRRHTIPSCHTVVIPNGFADAQGNVFSADGCLVLGASLAVRSHVDDYYVPQRVWPPVYKTKSAGVVTSSLQGGYYHWLFEVLPRIHMLRTQHPSTNRLFAQATHRFQRESLELLRIAGPELINSEDYEFVSAEELVVPFHEIGPRMQYPKWVSDFLRAALLPAATQERSADPITRLYISRDDAQWRRVVNEPEVLEVLEPLGFRPVKLGQASILQQVRLFHDAEVVVAPHGAALSNLVFSQPGTKVIEFQQLKLDACFFRLSRSLGLDHYYIRSSTGPSNPANNHQQITIDIRELKQTLRLASIC